MTSGPPAPAPRPEGWFRKTEAEQIDVGEFRQGSPLSQWALARYLVGRAVTESLGWSLLSVGVVLIGLAALAWWVLDAPVLGVLVLIGAVGVLLLRAIVLGVVRRLTSFRQYRPLEERMRALVEDTRSDVRAELRRIGLPGRLWTLPLLAMRLLGRNRRRQTFERLRQFDVNRAVPPARLDELHLVLRSALGTESR